MFKVKNALAPGIVEYIFEESNENHHNLRNKTDFRQPPIRTVCHGSKSISYLGPKI